MHIVYRKSFFLQSMYFSIFQVTMAQVSDTGRYVCVADNAAGSAEKLFNLNVHGESQLLIYFVRFAVM